MPYELRFVVLSPALDTDTMIEDVWMFNVAWLEVKLEVASAFVPAQLEPELIAGM